MAMSVPKMGMGRFMKEGARHYRGTDEVVERSIEACNDLAAVVRSCYGPYGMNKMVINHLEKLFVTNDAATILKELDVEHPAAKMLVMASERIEEEVGDGTNAVIILAAALLEHASELIAMGLKPVEVANGYEQAMDKALSLLPSLVCENVTDLRSEQQLTRAIRPSIMSKQLGYHDMLASLIAKACVQIMPKGELMLNVDNIRVCKILGSSVNESTVMNGMVFKRQAEGQLKRIDDAKIVVYTCPFDLTATETKGTVLINTAAELLNYSKGEEDEVQKQVDTLKEAGVNCVVSGGKFGDLYLHFLNAAGIMAVRIMSKFDLRRVCRTVNATALTRIMPPTPDQLGHCSAVHTDEVGDTEVVVFRQDAALGKVATIVVRGSSENVLDDIERAIDDGVNTVKALTKDDRVVCGAGACELELARQIESYGEKCAGIEQYSIKKFALALEALPKQLADNAGLKSTDLLSKLCAAHNDGKSYAGVDVTRSLHTGGTQVCVLEDAKEAGIVDLYSIKEWTLKLATNAAMTVLSIDQIIMAKQAGGPAPPKTGRAMDGNDPE
jgi:T-complex protein 1 subunit theta